MTKVTPYKYQIDVGRLRWSIILPQLWKPNLPVMSVKQIRTWRLSSHVWILHLHFDSIICMKFRHKLIQMIFADSKSKLVYTCSRLHSEKYLKTWHLLRMGIFYSLCQKSRSGSDPFRAPQKHRHKGFI
jgi:hypothetical protein